MPIAKKITPEEQSAILKYYHDLKTFYRIARNLAGEVDSLFLQAPNLYASQQGRAIRKSAYSVFDEIMEAYSFRKKQDIALHYLSQAYNASVNTVNHLLQEKSLERLRQRDTFKNLIRKYSEFQKMVFNFVKSIDEELVDANNLRKSAQLNSR
ncbi:MAG: S23 ribosomal protein [Candidatus Scalindua rubra]|uniref:S23 ribosomal protein n=1 Tax=Candidatus Scalindua rubra TaxID=1872076 RepID=A0A1E3XCZ1_9BACT|nr:MAG: S23 ribosomal protein [Candidatus Scalindua rubra]